MKTASFITIMFLGTNSLAQQLKPTETDALVKIKVSDFESQPRKNDIIILKSKQSSKEYKVTTNLQGYGELLVPKGNTYLVSYQTIAMQEKYDSFSIPQSPGFYTSTVVIKYEPAKSITLENVLFGFNKAELKASSFHSLDELASFMKIKTSMNIEIAGHTDNIGDSAYNKTLSQARAEAVRDYLAKKGIAAKRLNPIGYGANQPVADNDDEARRQQNRRTEIRIISE